MNRNVLVAVGGFALLAVALSGGAIMAAATVPPPEPLPVTTPITPPDTTDRTTPTPRPTMPTYDPPSARHSDLLRDDDVLVTREQLTTYAQENEWRIGPDYYDWVEVNARVIECMAGAGFWFDPRVFPSPNSAAPPEGFAFAMGGDTGAGDAYRWEDAGCWGDATHAVGTTS